MKTSNTLLHRLLQSLVLSAIFSIHAQAFAANTLTFIEDWEILPTGIEVAGAGDLYSVGQGFYNFSTQATDWNTASATLQFFKGGLSSNTTGNHEFTYAGLNLGSTSYTAFTNNFAWDRVEVQLGNQLINTNSSAVYTRALTLGGGISQISTFTGSIAIYYDFADARNGYLAGGTYHFGSGTGFVAPLGNVAYWAVNASSTWGIDSDWSTNKVPSFVGIEANFGPGVSGTGTPFSGPHTVTLDAVRTVGKLVFSDTNSFTLASGTGGSLLLKNSSLASQIRVTTGTHAITAPIALTSPGATVDVAVGGMLSISNSVSGLPGLTKSNSGTLTLTGSNTYQGATSVIGGTLNVDNSLASTDLSVAYGATLNLNVAAATGTATAVSVNGLVNFAGPNGTVHKVASLTIEGAGAAVLTPHTGGAANVKVLDVSALNISGVETFLGDGGKASDEYGSGLANAASVPEPPTIGLFASGAIAGAILRRRNLKSAT